MSYHINIKYIFSYKNLLNLIYNVYNKQVLAFKAGVKLIMMSFNIYYLIYVLSTYSI